MTRVDFYLLPDIDEDAKRRFSCRLAYRAVASGEKVHIRAAQTDDLDELLWEYPPGRFLPHAKLIESSGHEPVTIGDEREEPPSAKIAQDERPSGLLINAAGDIPEWFAGFARVAEVVLTNERNASREKYRHYRDRGYPLFHHQLEDWE